MARKPVDMSLYPPNWKEISLRIREREGHRCKWCGIPNHSIVHRAILDKFMWISHEEWLTLPPDDAALYGKASKIFLTVAHLNHTPADCRDENLAALCNRCHLNYDAKFHAQNAKKTRARRDAEALKEAGQLALFEVES